MSSAKVTGAPKREQWTGQLGFIFAAIGSAVGLGNIWRFPGVAYENGGGAFLIPYFVALLTAGIPILLFDYAIGHRFRGSAPLAFRRAAGKGGEAIGWFQVMINVFIATYYAVVVAWAVSYFVFSFDLKWGDDAAGYFIGEFLQTSEAPFTMDFVPALLIPVAAIWAVVLIVQATGVAKGIEKMNVVFLPLLVITFLALVIGALTLPGALEGVSTFFTPDFAALAQPKVWIAAYGQVFFSLSVAFGIMVTYSSYRKRRSNLSAPGLVVAFANSSFELLAGVGVFAALGFFAAQQGIGVSDIEGIAGVSLAFITFPAIVAEMPMSQLFGILFFGSIFLAGITSLISVLEVIISAVMDKFGLSRKQSVWGVGGLLAIVSLLLYTTTSGLNTLDVIDNWVNNFGIVFAAVVSTVVVMWIYKRGPELSYHVSSLSTFKLGRTWRFFVGILSPVVIGVMLVQVVVSLVKDGYGTYPSWYTNLFGWGCVAIMVLAALILTFVPWKRSPDQFVPYPAFNAKQGKRLVGAPLNATPEGNES
ncbi:sodium-dependent transporter [Leucobacter sp. cx-42]|uniref:sodium-dependent transporter n=1 Tax=unclassified Leucobacter TaxID=2621730 RepID=UPI00165D7736|nr:MULTISPECIES: sodium-dependent transporter [unclassified Leucobacter]MBC9954224.1 sodium-dependent transporter [Leucobacter sp. cx-42]